MSIELSAISVAFTESVARSSAVSPPFGRLSFLTSAEVTWLLPMSTLLTSPFLRSWDRIDSSMMSELPTVSAA